MYTFGSGVMTITPSGSVPTPINIGLLQEGSWEVSQSNKPLYGQYVDPIAIGAGTRKWTGKAKVARLSGQVLNAILFGGTLSSGYTDTAYEDGTVPGSVAYTITVSGGANFSADQGVFYAATGLPLKRVASVSAAGQYSVNTSTGVYTFNSTDANAKVVICYNYTVAGSGQSIVIPRKLLGSTLSFSLNFTGVDPTTNKMFTGKFYNCVAEKAGFGTKLEDWANPEIDFQMAANAAGNVGEFNFSDVF